MRRESSRKTVSLNFLIRNKVNYFSFLFDKGFEISRTSSFFESFGSWFIEFEAQSCFIMILSDHDEVVVSIYPYKSDRKVVMDLKPMIFYLTRGRKYIGNFEGNLAWETNKQILEVSHLLEDYIDQIIPLMGREFENIKYDCMLAGKRYIEIQIATYNQK